MIKQALKLAIHPFRTLRRMEGLCSQVRKLEESEKSLQLQLAQRCLSEAEKESAIHSSLESALQRESKLIIQRDEAQSELRAIKQESKSSRSLVSEQLKVANEKIAEIEMELALSKAEAERFRKQSIGLKNWIKSTHRLEAIPPQNTIKEILQRFPNENHRIPV